MIVKILRPSWATTPLDRYVIIIDFILHNSTCANRYRRSDMNSSSRQCRKGMPVDSQPSMPSGSGQSTSVQQQAQQQQLFENFCSMMVEEFLMKKKCGATLEQFRKEYNRSPDSPVSILSWYEIALRLHLPDIMNVVDNNANNANNEPNNNNVNRPTYDTSILENMLSALLRESSIRSRRATSEALKGLTLAPKQTVLPSITQPIEISNSNSANNANSNNSPRDNNNSNNKPTSAKDTKGRPKSTTLDTSRNKHNTGTADSPTNTRGTNKQSLAHEHTFVMTVAIKKNLDSLIGDKAKALKASSENWVPEITRHKSLERDIAVMKDNLSDIMKREFTQRREDKRFAVTDLDRARTEETLGATRKEPCSCCLQKYLYCNLPLKVTQKAILDLRRKWSGLLNSQTVFGGTMEDETDNDSAEGDHTDAAGEDVGSTGNGSPSSTRRREKRDAAKKKEAPNPEDRLSVVPRCYSEVKVCSFCAQFFRDQDMYRPSYKQIVYQEKKEVYDRNKVLLLEKNDPLKIVERKREIEEAKIKAELENISKLQAASEQTSAI